MAVVVVDIVAVVLDVVVDDVEVVVIRFSFVYFRLRICAPSQTETALDKETDT